MQKCPLLLSALLSAGNSSTSLDGIQETNCIKEKCAWWTVTEECAVLYLAKITKK